MARPPLVRPPLPPVKLLLDRLLLVVRLPRVKLVSRGRDYDRGLDCVQGQPVQDGN